MKRIKFTLTVLVMACLLFTACGKPSGVGSAFAAGDGKLHIVTTIFPEYDWVMNVLGDKADSADVTMLLENGVDLHSFQPTAEDILKISNCDIFIYVGGESDFWVDDVLRQAVNKDMVVINLLETLGDRVKEEEVVEGMEAEHDHDHEHEEGEDHDHEGEDHDHEGEGHDHEEEEEEEYDEHVWLSIENAEVLCDAVCEALVKTDSANASVYKKNTEDYKKKLKALDDSYREALKKVSKNTVLFGDRFPFRYLTDEYNLNYYAAFVGCSAESEASFETVIFLANKVDELKLPAILTIEGSNGKIAETIKSNTASKDQKILVMNSMQSVTGEEIKNGANYISIMEANLEVLKEALK